MRNYGNRKLAGYRQQHLACNSVTPSSPVASARMQKIRLEPNYIHKLHKSVSNKHPFVFLACLSLYIVFCCAAGQLSVHASTCVPICPPAAPLFDRPNTLQVYSRAEQLVLLPLLFQLRTGKIKESGE